MSDYHVWITVPGLPLDQETAWEPFISRVEEIAPGAGPILTWEEAEAKVIFWLAGEDEAEVARIAVGLVSEALHDTRLGDRYPSRVEVEPADAVDLQPA